MGVYSELLDTAWMGADERAAAMSILKIRALTRSPCELTTTHAINSRLILDDCAKNEFFRGLVEAGRIRFRLRPGGKNARQTLIESLSDRAYRLAWPGIEPEPESGDWQEALELRQAAIAVLLGRTKETHNDALNERLTNAKALFRAIETANYTVEESRHGAFFANRLRDVAGLVPGQYESAREILGRVAQLPSVDRSMAYTAIEQDPRCDGDLEKSCKGVVDSVYCAAVAYALGEKLQSVDRDIPLHGAVHSGPDRPKASSVSVLSFDESDGLARGLDGIVIDWENIHAATAHYHGGQASQAARDIAVSKLVTALTEKRMAVPAKEISAIATKGVTEVGAIVAGSAVATKWLVPVLGGALGSWAVTVGGGIAAWAGIKTAVALGNRVTSVRKEQEEERIRKALNGWLDRMDSDDSWLG